MLNIAVVGFGWWGRHMVERLKGHPIMKVGLIVETDSDRRDQITGDGYVVAADFDVALSDPEVDAVVLTTPSALHAGQVVSAADAGKHVFCEKPLALSAADARRAVAACRNAGLVLGLGHERRFEPAMRELKTMVDAGDLGTLLHAEAAFSHDKLAHVPPGDWRTTKKDSPAAGMTAMGIHLTDLYISMFGRVSTVQALVADRVLGWETGDVLTVQLGFESGMTATLSVLLATPVFLRLHVFGTLRWVEVRNSDHPEAAESIAELCVAESGVDVSRKRYARTDTVLENLEAFANAIATGEAYPISTDDMVHNIEVFQAIARSAERRETVVVAPE